MKKVLVILTVLILVASAVFAAETIKLVSVVETKAPTFVLRAGISPDSFNSESDDESNNTLGWQTIEKSILKDDVVVYFQIAQNGSAKKVGNGYALSIEATEMILSLNEDGTPLAPDATVYRTTKGRISDVSPINNEKSNIGISISAASKDSASLVAEYSGKVEDGTPIATFTVTWAKDVQAPDGIYQASVILRVSPQ